MNHWRWFLRSKPRWAGWTSHCYRRFRWALEGEAHGIHRQARVRKAIRGTALRPVNTRFPVLKDEATDGAFWNPGRRLDQIAELRLYRSEPCIQCQDQLD